MRSSFTIRELAESMESQKQKRQAKIEDDMFCLYLAFPVIIHSAVCLLMLKYGCGFDVMFIYILGAYALNTIHWAFYGIDKPETANDAFDAFLCNAVLFGILGIAQFVVIGGIVVAIGLTTGLIR